MAKNRYEDHDPADFDEAEYDDWMLIDEPEEDAILEREMAKYARLLRATPVATQIKISRRRILASCLNWRELARSGIASEFTTKQLKICQMRLLRLRAWRATGVYPGEG